MLEPGALVAGKLRIEKVLGQGGMGTVAAAVHVGLDQRVAIKLLKPELANQPEVVARFVREARASAKLRSEHVCRVSDVGETEDGQPYIEMELLEGQDLASLIRTAPLAVEVAADYVVQACVAIAEAHHLGIIHRDLKPANLFVTQRLDGSALIKVLDFGIATAPTSDELQITKTTTVMGSPGYMSPEHLRSARDVDARSDIWALGVILYEAVSGRLPFAAQSITELAVKVVMDEPEPLGLVDSRFAAVVARCLQKPPELRYQTVAELAGELAALGSQAAHTSALLVSKLLGAASSSRSHSAAQIPVTSPSGAIARPGIAALGVAPTMATAPPAGGPVPAAPPHGGAVPSTTLGSAASASLVAAPPARPRRTWPVVAALAVVGIAAAAGAFALVERSSETHGHGRRHREPEVGSAAPLIAAAPVATPADAPAAPAPGSAAAGTGASVADLQALADHHDYRGVLDVAGSAAASDPQAAAIVRDAKAKYVDQMTKELAEHVRRGECATAKLEAGEAGGAVPESASAFAAAVARCAAKGKPTTAAAGTAAAAAPTVDQAADAYARRDYGKALAIAQQVLETSPRDAAAAGVATRAACALHETAVAKTDLEMVPASERGSVLSACRSSGVSLLAATAIDAMATMHDAQRAIGSRDWATAEADAKKVLATEPNNHNAMHSLGIAACHLHHEAEYDDVMRRAPFRLQASIRRACNRDD